MAEADENKKEEKKEEKSSSGRWWEFYFVRYALGTVFGILIVDFLAMQGLPIPFPTGDIKEITKPESIPLLITYGLAFCYLASAPILLFHATRFNMQRTGIRWSSFLVFAACAIGAVTWGYSIPAGSMPKGLQVAAAIAIGLIACVLLFQVRAINAGERRAGEMWSFYKRLDFNRRVKANRELIDSYRHLREHGNAFAVVLFEMLLGFGLYLSNKISLIHPGLLPECSPKSMPCDPTSSPAIVQSFLLILFWILPGAYVWCIGCYLEAQFADDTTMGEAPGTMASHTAPASSPAAPPLLPGQTGHP